MGSGLLWQNLLSSTTICSYIHKCQLKLYCAKRKPYVNSVQKRRRLLWARRASGMDNHTVETCTVVRWIGISGIFWEEWTPCAPDQRRKGSRLLPATSPKAREHNMLPSRRHLFQDVHAYFNKTMQNHILHTLQSPGCGEEGTGTWLALPAVPTCLQ